MRRSDRNFAKERVLSLLSPLRRSSTRLYTSSLPSRVSLRVEMVCRFGVSARKHRSCPPRTCQKSPLFLSSSSSSLSLPSLSSYSGPLSQTLFRLHFKVHNRSPLLLILSPFKRSSHQTDSHFSPLPASPSTTHLNGNNQNGTRTPR